MNSELCISDVVCRCSAMRPELFESVYHQMNRQDVEDAIFSTQLLLQDGGEESAFAKALQNLGTLVQLSAQDQQYRRELALNHALVSSCLETLTNSLLIEFQDEENEIMYVRLVRGLLLFIRNLAVSVDFTPDITLLLLDIQHFNLKIRPSNPYYVRCFTAYIEVLANFMLSCRANHTCDILLVSHTFDSVLDVIKEEQTLTRPFTAFLNCILANEDNTSALLIDEKNLCLRSFVIEEGNKLSISEDVSDERLVKIFEKLITNKSFKKWTETLTESEELMPMLKVAQLIATSGTEWSNFQCTVIMEWSFEFLKSWSEQAIELLGSKEVSLELNSLHKKLVAVLDIISDLLKFHLAKQFLEHYNALDSLIPLFRAVHENSEIQTMKTRNTTTAGEQQSKNFPMVKSLIVEIMAFIVHNSFKSQEKVRELHGIELLLSNCIIDDNNPFIKERSILCLRFVLEKNSENQEFVAQLEAKKVVDDQALRDAGYQVEVDEGQVRLKKL